MSLGLKGLTNLSEGLIVQHLNFPSAKIVHIVTCITVGMESITRPEVSPYGPPVVPEEAPEAITQAVASLPPEQMFELMKQMKVIG